MRTSHAIFTVLATILHYTTLLFYVRTCVIYDMTTPFLAFFYFIECEFSRSQGPPWQSKPTISHLLSKKSSCASNTSLGQVGPGTPPRARTSQNGYFPAIANFQSLISSDIRCQCQRNIVFYSPRTVLHQHAKNGRLHFQVPFGRSSTR